MLTVSREKRFLKEIWVKRGEQYKPYCRESLRELVLYTCPGIGNREGTEKYSINLALDSIKHLNISWSLCGVYEEARETEEPGWFDDLLPDFGQSNGVGYGAEGAEWDREVNGFGCDFYEECCGEGCVIEEIGQEECF